MNVGPKQLVVAIIGWVAATFVAAQPALQSAGRKAEDLSVARAILDANGVASGRYRVLRIVRYASGGGMIWVSPTYRGLPVFFNERAFHFDHTGALKRDKAGRPWLGGHGHAIAGLSIDTAPRITAEEAGEIFAREARSLHVPGHTGDSGVQNDAPACAGQDQHRQSELGIFFPLWERTPTLAWRVQCRGEEFPVLIVSAADGRVLFFDTGIRASRPPGPPTVPLRR